MTLCNLNDIINIIVSGNLKQQIYFVDKIEGGMLIDLRQRKGMMLGILAVCFVVCFVIMYDAFEEVAAIKRYAPLISLVLSLLVSAALGHMLTYEQEL